MSLQRTFSNVSTLANEIGNDLVRQVSQHGVVSTGLGAVVVNEDSHGQDSLDEVQTPTEVEEDNNDKRPVGLESIEEKEKKKHRQFRLRRKDSHILDDPKQFPARKKQLIVAIIGLAALIGPISTTIYFPALISVQDSFQTTETLVNASLSMFVFFLAFFPLVWASFSDTYGRRRLYLISFAIYLVASLCCGFSVNIVMLICFRALAAVGSSAVMSLGAGTISDIYVPEQRGQAIGTYTLGPLIGPAVGPIIGGYLTQGFGWRSIFWFLTVLTAILWVLLFFWLPETWRAPVKEELPTNDADKQATPRKKRVNPIQSLALLRFPNMAVIVTYVAFIFIFMYMINTTFTRTLSLQYHLSPGTVGLCYLPNAIGSMLGGLIGGRYSDKVYRRKVAKNGGVGWPELRLGGILTWVGVFLMSAAFVTYGWIIQYNVHFAGALACQFVLGFSLMLPNIAINTYIVDCFKTRSASATACNNFIRYLTAGIGALVASDFEAATGDGIMYTICGCVLLAASPLLLVLIKNGKKWSKLREGL